ncbi:MAG: signal peptidase I [Mycobacteriales bacterium]
MSAHDDTALVGSPAESSGRGRRRRRTQLPLWQETILLLVTALVLAIVVKTFFLQAFFIPSGSMEPTLIGSPTGPNDRILVQKVSYWNGDPERGDIVVFDDPGGWLPASESSQPHNAVQRGLELFGLYPSGGHLIKRVIGVGGDRVKCCDAKGRVEVNRESLDEPYLKSQTSNRDRTFDVTVPDGYLWVMGDNRGNSADSRYHLGDPGGGFLPVDDVVGKAWVVVWPWDRIRHLDDPSVLDDPALDPAASSSR